VTTRVGGRAGALAERALRLATADPGLARRVAADARRAARRAGDPAAESTAERAAGLAAHQLQDATAALRHLRRAVRVAGTAGLAERAAEARMSLALVLSEAGAPARALREIDAAAPVLRGLPAARLDMQRALVLDRLSRFTEAMAGYTRAVAAFRRAGDDLWQARALTNRGVLHAYRGSLRQAEADLRAAAALHLGLGQELALAQVRHNLGFVAAVAGDVPEALRWYDLADEYFARSTRPAVALMDRGELLLRARLLPEARAAAEAAVAAARAGRMGLFVAQARLMLAEVALAAGDRAAARAEAAAAGRSFRRQGRPAWAALARYLLVRAGDDRPSARRSRAARAVADELARTGWPAPALDARLYAVRLAPGGAAGGAAGGVAGGAAGGVAGGAAGGVAGGAAGGVDVAGELRRVRAAGRRGPAELRARAWHAEALLRERAGDAAGARRALLAGGRVLDTHRAALGATELRALAGGYATELAGTGLRMALRGGRARSVWEWAERWKAVALRLPPTRPPDEAALAADLTELRRIVAELDTAPSPPRAGALLRERRAVEERIRRRSWRASGVPDRDAAGPDRAPAGTLAARLGAATLVELVECDGDLHAVLVHDGRFSAHRLCPVARATAELDALRFALRRIVSRHGGPAVARRAVAVARLAAARLDEALFGPVRGRLGRGPGALVVVPVGALHATPWSLLASCRGRAVTVAPSATVWLHATGAGLPGPGGMPVLVAGPGLDHAEPEVRRLAEVHRLAEVPAPATVLTGAAASAEAVLSAIDGAGTAHLAAHGVFRADNPMFSHLRLADGPLTVYDLERLKRPPALVVLSACDVGLSAVHPGDELMGLTAALLGIGTATVIGSVLPVRDETALELTVRLHHALADGAAPAAALAAAQAALSNMDGQDGPDGPLDERTVSAAAFVCFGAGDPVDRSATSPRRI
jgi:tetratricopeptide (TPR) repeat protein